MRFVFGVMLSIVRSNKGGALFWEAILVVGVRAKRTDSSEDSQKTKSRIKERVSSIT